MEDRAAVAVLASLVVTAFAVIGGWRGRYRGVALVYVGGLGILFLLFVTVEDASLAAAAEACGRYVAVGLSAIVFFEITTPAELVEAGHSLRLPRGLTIALGTGLRFIPIVVEESSRVVTAQRARGIDRGNLLRRLTDMPVTVYCLLVPVLLNVFSRVDPVWIAMKVRGMDLPCAEAVPLMYWRVSDLALLLIGIGALAASVFL
jgi:energy-coupling factor transport system permease protein